MIYITLIGLLAGLLSIIALTPQLFKTYKTKSTNDLSIKWLYINTVSQMLWFTFGILSNIIPIIITSSSVFILTVSLILMKIKYDSKK